MFYDFLLPKVIFSPIFLFFPFLSHPHLQTPAGGGNSIIYRPVLCIRARWQPLMTLKHIGGQCSKWEKGQKKIESKTIDLSDEKHFTLAFRWWHKINNTDDEHDKDDDDDDDVDDGDEEGRFDDNYGKDVTLTATVTASATIYWTSTPGVQWCVHLLLSLLRMMQHCINHVEWCNDLTFWVIFFSLNHFRLVLQTDGPTDQRTNGRMDRRTDGQSLL